MSGSSLRFLELFLCDRKFHFLSHKKRRSAVDAHSALRQSEITRKMVADATALRRECALGAHFLHNRKFHFLSYKKHDKSRSVRLWVKAYTLSQYKNVKKFLNCAFCNGKCNVRCGIKNIKERKTNGII